MIFHRVSGHDVYSARNPAGLFALKKAVPKKNDPGCIRRGHQFSSPGDSIRVTPDRTMCRYRPAIIAVDQHIAYRCYWIACRFSPPAVPERVAPREWQAKWADPRVSALGAALATAPFLIWRPNHSEVTPIHSPAAAACRFAFRSSKIRGLGFPN